MSVQRDDVCDYVIGRVCSGGETLNALKLQKLMYYVQAWHLAFYNEALFQGRFQAWIHGPVNRQLYDRFVATKSLFSEITPSDVREGFDATSLTEDARAHVDSVLDVYAGYSGPQLEDMTHREEPWVKARERCRPTERCEREIDESLMGSYYRSRLPK